MTLPWNYTLTYGNKFTIGRWQFGMTIVLNIYDKPKYTKLVNDYIHSITYIERQKRVAEKEAELLVFFFVG